MTGTVRAQEAQAGMSNRFLVTSVLLVMGLAGCSSGEASTMPEVVGEKLDIALSDIERAGIGDDVEVVGGGMFGVVDESNWEVCDQFPVAGVAVTDAPRLTVDRSCDAEEPAVDDGEARTQDAAVDVVPSDEAATTSDEVMPSRSDEAPAEPLTVETNEAFAQIMTLTDTCSQEYANFSDRYSGQRIEFEGSIVAINNHGSYNTRYDILINVGEYSETVAAPGPNFHYRDVNTTNDLHYTSDERPDTIGVGTNLHIVAEVLQFEERSCLLLLDPVATSFN